MTPKQRKEELSKAYVHAVAAASGLTIGAWSQDHGCVDVSIKAADKAVIDLQLKATSRQSIERADHLAFQLEPGHYDTLRRAEVAAPHYLVVLWLPEAEEDWWAHSVEQLLIRKCAYYVLMTGMPARDAEAPTVRVPLDQPFGPDALLRLMDAARRLEHLLPIPTPDPQEAAHEA